MMYRFVLIIAKIYVALFYRVRFAGKPNIPKGAALICANHTSGADPVFIAAAFKCGDKLSFMAKSELFHNKLFGWFLTKIGAYPIHRGESDMNAVKKSLSILKSGKKLLMFPEGRRVRGEDSSEVKNGVSMLALKTGAPILPVFVTAGRKALFCRLTVVFGEPYTVEKQKAGPEVYRAIGEELMMKIHALGAN